MNPTTAYLIYGTPIHPDITRPIAEAAARAAGGGVGITTCINPGDTLTTYLSISTHAARAGAPTTLTGPLTIEPDLLDHLATAVRHLEQTTGVRLAAPAWYLAVSLP